MGSANDSHRQHDTPPQGTTYKIIKSSVGVHVDFGDFRTQLQQKKAEVPKNLQKAMDLEIICPMGVDRLTLYGSLILLYCRGFALPAASGWR